MGKLLTSCLVNFNKATIYINIIQWRLKGCLLKNFIHVFSFLAESGVKYLFPVQAKTFDHVYDGYDLITKARKYAVVSFLLF